MHQKPFGRSSAPEPAAGGAYDAPQTQELDGEGDTPLHRPTTPLDASISAPLSWLHF